MIISLVGFRTNTATDQHPGAGELPAPAVSPTRLFISTEASSASSPSGAGSANGVLLLDAKTFQRKNGLSSPEFTGAFAFLQDGKQIAMGCQDGTLRIMALGGDPVVKFVTQWKGHDAPVTRIAIDAQERIVVSGDAKGMVIAWPLQ